MRVIGKVTPAPAETSKPKKSEVSAAEPKEEKKTSKPKSAKKDSFEI